MVEQPSQLKYIEWPSFTNTLKTATLMSLLLVAVFIVALSLVDYVKKSKTYSKLIHLMSSKIRAEKEPSSLMNSLPDDLIVDIIAHVPICNYPNLSLVSKHFKSLVASPELYTRRSLLGCTEPCIYVLLHDLETGDTGDYLLYILRPKANNNRLVFIRLLPRRSSIVAVGSKIYVFGDLYDFKSTTVLSIDCRSHTVQPLPSMPMPMAGMVIDIIDEKIYIIGYSDIDLNDKVIAVFNTETQKWEPQMTKVDMEIYFIWGSHCVVMADKMYLRDFQNCFVYEPKENKWETDVMLNSERWKNACLLDDVLYYFDIDMKTFKTYDTKQRLWGVVKLVGTSLFPVLWWPHTVNYGRKLAMFWHRYDGLGKIIGTYCAEISMERREGGEIWGKVEWSDVVLEGRFTVMKCLVVTV